MLNQFLKNILLSKRVGVFIVIVAFFSWKNKLETLLSKPNCSSSDSQMEVKRDFKKFEQGKYWEQETFFFCEAYWRMYNEYQNTRL